MDNRITWQVEHYPTLPSTNDYCIKQAKLGKKNNLVILADSQSAPRGSRGRQWIEPSGNLAVSFLYWPVFSVEKVGWIPFVASLALYDAVVDLCGFYSDLYIKWPNDLLFQEKKIAGILIESHVEYPDKLKWLVIGLGVNIQTAPQVNNRIVGCLRDFVKNDVPTALDLSKKLEFYLTYWLNCLIDNQEEFIRQSWLKKSLSLNTSLSVMSGNSLYKGVYKGIDQNGFLLLETETGLKTFSVGELFCLNKNKEV